MSNEGQFSSGGVTRVTSLPTASTSLRGTIFYLSTLDGNNRPGYYTMSEDTIEWDSIGTGKGKIYITNILPTPGQTSKNVTINDDNNSANTVSIESTGNTNLLRVYIRAIGESTYRPSATIKAFDSSGNIISGTSLPVTFSAPDQGGPEWETYIDINVGATSGAPYDVTIEVEHTDGARFQCLHHVVFGPVITNIEYVSEFTATGSGHTNVYPLTTWGAQQSEVKSGDNAYIRVTCDTGAPAMTGIYVYGSTASLRISQMTTSISSTYIGYFTVQVNNIGTSATNRNLTIKANKADGVFGEDFTGGNTLLHNNIVPSVSLGSITYPAGQSALKDAEGASLTAVILNADSARPPEEELVGTSLVLTSPPSYTGGTVQVSRQNITNSVGLLESGTNYRLRAFRSANGATSPYASKLFWIQNDVPVVTITEPATRLRSGGNDGTGIQTYTITASSNQNISTAPSMALGHTPITGGWLSSTTFAGSGNTWTNSLRVHDADPKGTFTWGAISITNRAGRVSTSITGNSTYTLGGFVERTVTVDPYANTNQHTLGVDVTDTSKLLCYNLGELNTWTYFSDTNDHDNGFTILDSIDGNVSLGNVWKSVDYTFNSARTVDYDVRIEETV